jgi:very-short-patch-repair endonuclease
VRHDRGVRNLIIGSDAVASGRLTHRELRRDYTMVYRNVYLPRGAEFTARERAAAAWLWSNRSATLGGLSAAALHGSRWVPVEAPAELIRTRRDKSPPGIVIRKDTLAHDEVEPIAGIPCTTVQRTAFDLGRRLDHEEAVIRIDALLNATRVPLGEVCAVADRYPGARNVRRLRRVLSVVDGGAESPQETRVRLLLVEGGLPRPTTQIRVGKRRVDMGWPDYRVGVEYDGEQHWSDPREHAGDINRLEYLAGLGWTIVRVSAWHLRRDRDGIVRRAAEALRARGRTG